MLEATLMIGLPKKCTMIIIYNSKCNFALIIGKNIPKPKQFFKHLDGLRGKNLNAMNIVYIAFGLD